MTIHIATSEDIGRAARRGLRLPIHFVSDNLLVGPCAKDPELHAEQRGLFWGLQGRELSRFRSSFAKLSTALQAHQPLVLWSSPLWSDTVMLWAICAWRLYHRPAAPDMQIILLGDAQETGFAHGSIRLKPADMRLSLDNARSLSLTRIQDMARSWRKLCGRSPLLSGARAQPGQRYLVELGAYQAAFFPRRKDARTLSLSRFDELLFSCLGDTWATPLELFIHPSMAGEELRKWLTHTGDIFLAMRLRQWALHLGDKAALKSDPCQPGNPMNEARYSLSQMGDMLKRNGLADISQGAPLRVWGARAYDPKAPWVLVADSIGQESLLLDF